MPPPLRQASSRRDSNTSSEYSDRSYHSRSTAPTTYSDRPSLKHYETDLSQYRNGRDREWEQSFYKESGPRTSVETYASTVPSEIDLEDDVLYEEPPPEFYYEPTVPSAFPTTPPEFAEYFPSTRRLCIRHDDTIDGNMNLRIDTETQSAGGRRVDLTLFHLRMHDLKSRDFSLRRYCRNSGREVCHSSRKYTKPASERRPGLQRSVSNVLGSLMFKSESRTFTKSSLKRTDSGYDSMDEDGDGFESSSESFRSTNPNNLPIPTNPTLLEFSNYAHIDLKRRGAKSSKRYEFEYWGTSYVWRRIVKKNGISREISYHLYDAESALPIAHIVPNPMTPSEAAEEEAKGGWVPPSSMWISEPRIFSGITDVAE